MRKMNMFDKGDILVIVGGMGGALAGALIWGLVGAFIGGFVGAALLDNIF